MSGLIFIIILLLIVVIMALVWIVKISLAANNLLESVNNNLIDIETALNNINR